MIMKLPLRRMNCGILPHKKPGLFCNSPGFINDQIFPSLFSK